MNNGMSTERAIRGLFQGSSYITINDKYGEKPKPDSRHIGKQFSHEVPHQGMSGARANNVLFERKHEWLFGGEKYIDRTQYAKTQLNADRKLAFQSHDAKRRDEFTQHFPSEQWREALRKESAFQKGWTAEQMAKRSPETLQAQETAMAEAAAAASAPRSWPHGPKHLFDVGRAECGGVTSYEKKDPRDRFYSHHRTAYSTNCPGAKKNYGPYMLSSQSYGYGQEGVKVARPAFARMPIVRDTFFRSTGILSTGRSPCL